jgi:1-acyl-sn-glycerol-3-phosphate acyltransferase
MQNIIVEKPYRFVPPYPGEFWTRFFRYYLPRYLRRTFGIATAEIRGIELLQDSIRRGHGIVLAPNHCRPSDPLVMGLLNDQSGRPIHTMASWHLFTEGRFKAWVLRRIGGFSIFREGLDREALRAAIRILVEAKRPLVIFPEGVVSRTNDRLGTLQEGVAFIARAAAKQRARSTPAGQVVIHPVALKYFFEGDLAASVTPVLEAIETRLSWRPQRQLPLLERIYRVGLALLSLKEIEHLGRSQPSTLQQRLSALIDHLLGPLEKEWLNGQREPAVVERVKRLRSAIVPDLVAGEITEEERARRWGQLADIYLAQQLACYPADYISERPTPERLLETVERFEEDLTDVARTHGPLRVVIQLGPALEVSPAREKGGSEDPLLMKLEHELLEMLQRLANEPRKTLGA